MHEGSYRDKYVFTWKFIACATKSPKKRASERVRVVFSLRNGHGGIINGAFSIEIVPLVF